MPFDLTQWKSRAGQALHDWQHWLTRQREQTLPYLAYGYLSSAALWPLVEALRSGETLPVMMAIGSVAGGVGGNLLANRLQAWKDRVEGTDPAALAGWIVEEVQREPELRAALDEVVAQLNLIKEAQAGFDTAGRQWFAETLRAELAQLGNLERFEAQLSGTGAIAQGEGARAANATDHSLALAGDAHDVTYIAHQEVHHPPPADPEAQRREEARLRYLQRLYRHCQALPLPALGGEEGAEEEVTLDQVYIALDTTTRVPLTEAEQEARKKEVRYLLEGERDSRPLTAMEAAAQTTRLALLGDPGAGKSTFARKLLVWLAATNLGEADPPPGFAADLLPVLVTLRDLGARLGAVSLESLSADQQRDRLLGVVREQIAADLARLEAGEFAEELLVTLHQGRCLLVLDGLDEVPHDLRRRVRQATGAVMQAYQPARIILTCRVRSYEGEARVPGFTAHTLAPFDKEKIGNFAQAWYAAQKALGRLDSETARRKGNDLAGAARADDLRELAQNPMLLTTMAIIHQREIGLPRERVRLYKLAVEVLLRRWQKWKAGELVPSPKLATFLNDPLRLPRVMERLAYETHRAGQGQQEAADLGRGEALTLLEQPEHLGDAGLAAEFLDYVDQRAGLLVGRGSEPGRPALYSFPHRTFQEYLAGCHMLQAWDMDQEFYIRAGEGDYWALAAQLGAEELLYNNKREPELLKLMYTLCPANPPQTIQDRRAELWASNMAVLLGKTRIEQYTQRRESGPAFLQRLIARLVDLLASDLPPIERAEAGRNLAVLGDPRPGVGVRADGLPDIAWREVPAGPFLMGSDRERDEAARDEETPQHPVELPAFQISQYPITNGQYQAFVETGGYANEAYWSEANAAGYWQAGKFTGPLDREGRDRPYDFGSPFNLANQPVVGVSWYEAVAFCRWLSEQLGHIVRLPSEAEWEKAARGGDGHIYPWGDEADPNRANYDDTKIGATNAVGCFPGGVSPYGCEEMSGNVWEWCATKWGKEYPYNAGEPEWNEDYLEGDPARVLRGGSWDNFGLNARCAVRYRFNPNNRYYIIGFRVVSPI